MITNWGYLILNNRDYWVDKMVDQAEAVRLKLANLPWVNWRQHFPPADQPGGFNIFAFIDNTMIKMCRPGGGPLTDGEAAPRLPKEIQQAWWTGWKKLHGMKWQSVTIANGLDFEVWGSCISSSSRRVYSQWIEDRREACAVPSWTTIKV